MRRSGLLPVTGEIRAALLQTDAIPSLAAILKSQDGSLKSSSTAALTKLAEQGNSALHQLQWNG
jgi:hypothetical protein